MQGLHFSFPPLSPYVEARAPLRKRPLWLEVRLLAPRPKMRFPSHAAAAGFPVFFKDSPTPSFS